MPSRKKARATKTRSSRHTVVLRLEHLEDRLCPSNYIWTNRAGNGTWEDVRNWRSTDGGTQYPGKTAGDVANLNGATDSNTNITMTNTETISSLNITSYGATLTLNQPLTLTNGGSMTLSPKAILANPGAATLTISGGTFNWSTGSINFIAGTPLALGTISVSTGAEFDTNYSGAGFMSLADNVTNNGTIKLANTGQINLTPSKPGSVPLITNYATIDVQANNPNGLLRSSTSDPYKTIQNIGTFKKSAGTGSYVIDEPISSTQTTSVIQVQTGTLNFTGFDPSTNQSITQGPNGSIQISAGATLAGQYITVSGGTVSTVGTSTTTNPSTISTLTLTINNFTTVNVGDASDSAVLFLQHTSLDWNMGMFTFYYNLTANTGSEVLFDSTGGATISPTNTSVGINFFGTGTMPTTWNVMDDSLGTGISNVAQVNPAGWNAAITGGGTIYTLTKAPPLGPG